MRLRAAVVSVAALPVLVLAACSSGTDSAGSTTAGSTTASSGTEGTVASSSSTVEPTTLGPDVPPATAVAPAVPPAEMPTASGKFGEKPTLTFPSTPPPADLQRIVLSEGDGPVVDSSDWVVANYLGQIWDGEVFDNSYDRGEPTTFSLGKVVPGWTVGLSGVKVGSRVLLSLPPSDGYGINGNPGAGISGTDTITFVVDIVDAIGPDQGGQADATPQDVPDTLPKVTGDLGKVPTIEIGNAVAPTKTETVLLAKGTGDVVTDAGSVLAQYEAVNWDGTPVGTTWPDSAQAQETGSGTGAQEIPLSAEGAFAGLAGLPIGSRVLIMLPAATDSSGGEQQAIAVVVDILAQTATA